jgi:hypothetical protein
MNPLDYVDLIPSIPHFNSSSKTRSSLNFEDDVAMYLTYNFRDDLFKKKIIDEKVNTILTKISDAQIFSQLGNLIIKKLDNPKDLKKHYEDCTSMNKYCEKDSLVRGDSFGRYIEKKVQVLLADSLIKDNEIIQEFTQPNIHNEFQQKEILKLLNIDLKQLQKTINEKELQKLIKEGLKKIFNKELFQKIYDYYQSPQYKYGYIIECLVNDVSKKMVPIMFTVTSTIRGSYFTKYTFRDIIKMIIIIDKQEIINTFLETKSETPTILLDKSDDYNNLVDVIFTDFKKETVKDNNDKEYKILSILKDNENFKSKDEYKELYNHYNNRKIEITKQKLEEKQGGKPKRKTRKNRKSKSKRKSRKNRKSNRKKR